MGIFPEIHRAWVTIDNKFFIWSYLDGSDFNEYDELDQIIISAGLVKPKPGVFKDYVKYLLVLATPVEVVLVALTFNNNTMSTSSAMDYQQHSSFDSQTGAIYSEMELFPTNYIIPSDNVNMLKIVGTQNGRIFMCGKDGCLYELTYEPEEGWFKSKCRKLNHSQSFVGVLVPSFLKFSHEDPIIDLVVDDTRNVLYTLSENMTIEVYDLGRDGNGMTRVVTYPNLVSDAIRKSLNPNRDFSNLKIISIAPVTSDESKSIHLIATSSAGDRFFFSTNVDGGIPIGLSLIHIKTCSTSSGMLTGFKTNAGPIKGVHECFYKNGVFLMADHKSDEVDNLICISMERKSDTTGGFGGPAIILNENTTIRPLEGRSHAIAEIPLYLDPLLVPSENPLNELSLQHIKPPREFVCLSNNGMHLLIKLRPSDLLQQILQQTQADYLLKNFFDKYGYDEACAMCVMLACSPPAYNNITDSSEMIYLNDEQLIKRAEETFFKFGGEPRFELMMNDRRAFPFNDVMGGPVATQDNLSFSAQHNALYLYFARLLRPLWKYPVVNSSRLDDNDRIITGTRFSLKQLKYMQQSLLGLLCFMERHHFDQETQPAHNQGITDKLVNLYHAKKDEEAKKLEHKSLSYMYGLLKRCYQALLFLYYMTRCGIGKMLHDAGAKRVNRIATTPFCDLVLTEQGEEIMREMARLVILNGENVDSVCDSLKVCDVFFNEFDLEEYKALNALEKAKDIRRRDELIVKSLEMYKRIAGHINVLVVCKAFQKLGSYTGAVELALTSAEQKDPKNLAIEWVKAGRSALDVPGQQAFSARIDCYNCALSVLEEFMKQSEGFTMIGGLRLEQKSVAPSIEKEKMFSNILKKMASSKDQLFHETLYQWLMEHGLSDKLLTLKTPYIENFLLKQNKQYYQLSTYYAMNGRHDKAAKVLEKLAESKDDELSLDQRIQYLAHAINYAKSAQVQDDLLNVLLDKLDVAIIQKRVLSQILELNPPDVRNLEKELNGALFDLTALFNNYADPYNLLESKLCILHCARYKDYNRIQELWSGLINSCIKNIPLLEDKIVSLGKELSGIFFPLEYICGELENRTTDKQQGDWVIKLMRDRVKIKYVDLYNAYHNLFILLDHPTSTDEDDQMGMFAQNTCAGLPNSPHMKLRILNNIAVILTDWVKEIKDQSVEYYAAQQTFSLGDINRDIDDYVSALGRINGNRDQIVRIEQKFKDIQKSFK